jgi:predicted nuclease of predicted toxin-antitoxin system
MRFLVDECSGPGLAEWLRSEGHDVASVFEIARGAPDEEVVRMASEEKRTIVTNDKDFGEMVFRKGHSHYGIVLLRLDDERTQIKIEVMRQLLSSYADRIGNNFIVVTEDQVRFARE